MNDNRNEKIEELTLLLMYLTAWDKKGFYCDENDEVKQGMLKHSWKGYSFDALNGLTDKGYLFPTKNSNKSRTLTKEGEKVALELVDKYLKEKC